MFHPGNLALLLKVTLYLLHLPVQLLARVLHQSPGLTGLELVLLRCRLDDILLDGRFQVVGHAVDGRHHTSGILCRHRYLGVIPDGVKGLVELVAKQLLLLAHDHLRGDHHLAMLIHAHNGGIVECRLRVAAALLLRLVHLLQYLAHYRRRTEDVGDVSEQQVAHKAAPHHLLALYPSRDAHHLSLVYLHHPSLLVFGYHGKEVQQLTDVLLPLLRCAVAPGGGFLQVVGKLIVEHQRPGGVEVKDVGILLPHYLPSLRVFVGILCPEGRLHIELCALHVAEHQHAAPFGYGHSCGQLGDAQGDGLVVGPDGLLHPIVGLDGLPAVVGGAVAGGQHHLVVLKSAALLPQQPGHGLGTVHAVGHQPERVGHLPPQFRCGEGEFLLRGQCLQQFLHVCLVLKPAVLAGLKEFVQVEGIVYRISLIERHTLPHLLAHDVAHAIGEEVQPWHVLIGIMVIGRPSLLGLLLVGIAPVEELAVGKLPRGDGLEGRATEVEGELALDAVEGPVGAHGLHALVALVHYQHVPAGVSDPLQLVEVAAEVHGAFQSLEALEAYLPGKVLIAMGEPAEIHVPGHHPLAAPQRVVVAHEAVARLPGHVFLIVVIP